MIELFAQQKAAARAIPRWPATGARKTVTGMKPWALRRAGAHALTSLPSFAKGQRDPERPERDRD